MAKKKKEEKEEDYIIEFESKIDVEEAKIVGWVCPICAVVYSPYVKLCISEDCYQESRKLTTGYITGKWKAVNK